MVYKVITARAPVNIAVIKYWGKANEDLKIPINDSISGTLSIDDLCATTTIKLSDSYGQDQLWLNKIRQDLEKDGQRFKLLIEHVRNRSPIAELANIKVHIFSENNFPTAAGLASSAAGYACLSFVLGHAFGITDTRELSIIARIGSGSACRSLYGGFVRWHRGNDSNSSIAEQLFDQNHWPEIRVVICVVNDSKKDTSSSVGMRHSTDTSELLRYRADKIVSKSIDKIIDAIKRRDFESFGHITMQDSNQFHAICLDTWPPINYLNDISWSIIRLCLIINEFYNKTKVAYTFDAGPNACIYTTEDMLDKFVAIAQYFYPPKDSDMLKISGRAVEANNNIAESPGEKCSELTDLMNYIEQRKHKILPGSLSYLICTKIGEGPRLINDDLSEP